jgi:elongation factor G
MAEGIAIHLAPSAIGYIGDLRTMTSGRGQFSMEFSHYSQAPRHVVEQVTAEVKAREEALKKK